MGPPELLLRPAIDRVNCVVELKICKFGDPNAEVFRRTPSIKRDPVVFTAEVNGTPVISQLPDAVVWVKVVVTILRVRIT
jgi:hypothetical protein